MKKNILALGILTLMVASAADAYVLLSPTRRWGTVPVPVRVYTTGNSTINDSDRGVTAVVGAVRAWAVVGSATTSSAAVRGSAPATIMLNTNGNICTGSCLAATLTGYYSGSTIRDADVYTNTRYSFTSSRETDGCSSEFDINGIMVHEVGHVIGIGHSNVAGATMYPTVSSCNIGPRSLEADDLAAMNFLY
ncbi:MAG TPA: matrixin family metalloprotease [Thermoanaerobaculia bacterium]